MTLAELAGKLQSLAQETGGKEGPGGRITVWADRDCAFGDVAAVLRTCRESGIEAIHIATHERDR